MLYTIELSPVSNPTVTPLPVDVDALEEEEEDDDDELASEALVVAIAPPMPPVPPVDELASAVDASAVEASAEVVASDVDTLVVEPSAVELRLELDVPPGVLGASSSHEGRLQTNATSASARREEEVRRSIQQPYHAPRIGGGSARVAS